MVDNPPPKTTRRAPTVDVEHTKRRMKSYMVYDWELEQLSSLDGWTTTFASAGSFFASFAIGLWTDLFIEGSPAPAAAQYGTAMQNWFIGIAIVFYLFAGTSWRNRKSKIDRMKRDIVE